METLVSVLIIAALVFVILVAGLIATDGDEDDDDLGDWS